MRRAHLRNRLVSDAATRYRILGHFPRHLARHVHGRDVRGQRDAFACHFNAPPSLAGLCAVGTGHRHHGHRLAVRVATDRQILHRRGNAGLVGASLARNGLRVLPLSAHSVDGRDPARDSAVDHVDPARRFMARFFLRRQYRGRSVRLFVRRVLPPAPLRRGHSDLCGSRVEHRRSTHRIWLGAPRRIRRIGDPPRAICGSQTHGASMSPSPCPARVPSARR